MKTCISLVVAAIIGIGASATTASAQNSMVRAYVPFEFTVGETALARGVYDVADVGGSTAVLLVRSMFHGAFVLGLRAEPVDGVDTPALVFHRYGDRYFLREIRMSGLSAIDLPETPVEREAAARVANRFDATVITIAALR
jgi:hypothetical protein